jgi:hypothetical protein
MRACYSHDYCVPTRLGGLEKLGQVAQEVQRGALAELHNPPVLNTGHLYALHDPAYVDAFLQGEGSLAISQNLPWSQALRGAVLAMQAGQLQAAEMALRDGISAAGASVPSMVWRSWPGPGRRGVFSCSTVMIMAVTAQPSSPHFWTTSLITVSVRRLLTP